MKNRLPRLARLVRSYLRLFDPDAIDIEFIERTKLKGARLRQMRREVERLEKRRLEKCRAGSTLTEVLIALLIMSIGLVAIAVLFPISVMRSIRATQLTNATDLRYNAEAAIAMFPNTVRQNLNGANYYVFDPLGFSFANALPATQALANNWGNIGGTASTVPRYPMSWNTIPNADSLVTLPDSWIMQFDGFVDQSVAPTPTQVSVKSLAGVTMPAAIPNDTTPLIRAVMFSADGLSSQTRTLSGIAGTAIQWTDSLPSSFTPGGRVAIQIQERRYTWLLTVRPSGTQASVDVVVFFQRHFDPVSDEALYSAAFTAGSTSVSVTMPPKLPKKGSYILDATNGYWYRISNVNQSQNQITIDVPATASSPAGSGYAMYPPAIVDVYPLGNK